MSTISTPSSRPIYVAEELPIDSRLNCLVMLAEVVPHPLRKELIAGGHNIITRAKSMKDLGYSDKTYIDGFPNFHNRHLTSKIFVCDQGLYIHLLNKITRLITNGVLSRKDHLGIIAHHIRDVSFGVVVGPIDKTPCGMAARRYVASVTATPSH